MDKKTESKLRSRWTNLEERSYQISAMLDELNELEEEHEDISIKTTAAYMLLQEKLLTISKEQEFIESLWSK